MPQPRIWFKLQKHVNDSAELRSFNSQGGNKHGAKKRTKAYLGGDNAGVPDMLIRAKHIHNILQRWQFITTSL